MERFKLSWEIGLLLGFGIWVCLLFYLGWVVVGWSIDVSSATRLSRVAKSWEVT